MAAAVAAAVGGPAQGLLPGVPAPLQQAIGMAGGLLHAMQDPQVAPGGEVELGPDVQSSGRCWARKESMGGFLGRRMPCLCVGLSNKARCSWMLKTDGIPLLSLCCCVAGDAQGFLTYAAAAPQLAGRGTKRAAASAPLGQPSSSQRKRANPTASDNQ